MSHPIRMVCFDLGGVLIRICRDWREACGAAGIPARPEVDTPEFEEPIRALDASHQLGLLEGRMFFRRASEAIGGLYSPEEIGRIHDAWLLGEYPGAPELVSTLHAGDLETACLSNTNARHWELMEGNGAAALEGAAGAGERVHPGDAEGAFPAFRRLRARHASHLFGLMKPDPAIYRAFERATGRRGKEILFFDDLAANVAAARDAGWHAEEVDRFGDPVDDMIRKLREYGILPPP